MRFAFLLPAACLLCSTGANAASSLNLEFGGEVLSTCTVLVGLPGLLDVADDGKTLTSTSGTGRAATATVTATGATFRLSVSTPTLFNQAPAGGNTGVAFQTSYSMSGLTSALNVLSGVSTPLNIGLSTLSVHLTATRPTIFPSGTYGARSVVTCE